MERLEKKTVNGSDYYYYSIWGKVNGKCRRIRQVYLGKLADVVSKLEGKTNENAYAEVFSRGLPMALYNEAANTRIIEIVDKHCPKRRQGLTVGDYIALAAINRGSDPTSKRSTWEWFSKTSLIRTFPAVSKTCLTSQRFWDHMNRIKSDDIEKIWEDVSKVVMENEEVNMSSVHMDGTNFYTFIDTFNTRCEMPKNGKNKQKRSDLRQVNYSLFCSEEHQIPLYFDVYDGNRNDYTQFPLVIEKFHKHLQKITGGKKETFITLIFDKGNNSIDNLNMLEEKSLHFVTSVRPAEVKELAQISKNSKKFQPCIDDDLAGTSAYRTKHKVLGVERTVIVTFSEALYEREWKTIHRNIEKALGELKAYQQKLNDRIGGVVTKGKKPTKEQVLVNVNKILKKPYLKTVINTAVDIANTKTKLPRLKYSLDEKSLSAYCRTSLGKTILTTTRDEWGTEKIIKSYRSQYIVEDVFKELKNRDTGSWWPMFHWTDSKIRVHALYCSIALLFRSLMMKRVKSAGINITSHRLLKELEDIKEVVHVTPHKDRRKKSLSQTILTRLSEVQEKLASALHLQLKNFSI